MSKRYMTWLLIAIAAVALNMGVRAEEAPPAPDDVDPQLWSQLVDLDRRVATIEDFTATVHQARHTPLLREPLLSYGRVFVRADRARWEMFEPYPTTTLVTPDTVSIHYPDQKLLEVYDLQDHIAPGVVSPLPRLESLKKHFRFLKSEDQLEGESPAVLAVELIPRDEHLLEYLDRVTVWLDLETGCVVQIQILDPDGERSLMRLENHEINTQIDEQVFELDVPEDTRISHPRQRDDADGES